MKRAEAKELGLRFYFTGKPCKRGHVTNRRTGCGSCVDCASATTKAWQDANPDPDEQNVPITDAGQQQRAIE